MSAGKASSASFVSCMHRTSGWISANHASTRGSRTFSELTFHVARRTPPTVYGERRDHPDQAGAAAAFFERDRVVGLAAGTAGGADAAFGAGSVTLLDRAGARLVVPAARFADPAPDRFAGAAGAGSWAEVGAEVGAVAGVGVSAAEAAVALVARRRDGAGAAGGSARVFVTTDDDSVAAFLDRPEDVLGAAFFGTAAAAAAGASPAGVPPSSIGVLAARLRAAALTGFTGGSPAAAPAAGAVTTGMAAVAFVDFRVRFVGVAEAATSSAVMPVIEAANSGAARSMPRRCA